MFLVLLQQSAVAHPGVVVTVVDAAPHEAATEDDLTQRSSLRNEEPTKMKNKSHW